MRKTLVLAAVAGGILLARRRYEWRDRVVLVAGGSRGLGLLLARRFGRRGAKVVLAARSRDELEAARSELEAKGISVHVVVADVAVEEQAFAMVEEAVRRFGRLDVLVNAASIIQVAPLEATSLQDLHAALDVNFWGTVHACWAALPHLAQQRGSRIVNISSIGGVVSVPHLFAYCCGKFAVTGFSQGLQAEVEKDGVRVVTIVPGLMRTGSTGHALVKGNRAAEAALFHLAGSLPVITLAGERAADRIVRAAERGERFVTLGVFGKTLRIANALAPGLAGAALGLVARLLPSADEMASIEEPSEAREHASAWTRSPLTLLGRRAAVQNNELGPGPS